METQDHKMTDPAGHEEHGIHVCHKCGWSFPNPHPSAKHRRAHKRVCGTVEGYKLFIDPEEKAHLDAASDDEDLSDEDHKSPSSEMVERTISRRSSSGVGGGSSRSNRSEDDVFSDTVTDFADIPVTEEVSDGIRGLENMAGKASENDTDPSQFTVENAVAVREIHAHLTFGHSDAGNLCSENSKDDGTLPQTIQHLRTGNDLVESIMLSQDHSRSPVDPVASSVWNSGREELVVSENTIQSSIASTVMHSHTEGTMGIFTNKSLAEAEILSHGFAGEAFEVGNVVEDVNGETSDSVPAKAIVDLTEKQSDGLKPQNDSSAEVAPTKGINSSADYNYLMNEGNGQLGSSVDMDKDHGKKCKEDDSFHILKVPEDLPFTENTERMLKGYKDHNAGKFGFSAPLDSSLTVEPMGSSGDFVMLESQRASHSIEAGGPKSDLPKVQLMEDKLQEGIVCDKPMAEEATGKGPAQISEIKSSDANNLASSGIEVHPETNRREGGQVLSSDNFSQIVLAHVAVVESCDSQGTRSTTGDMSAYNEKDIGNSNAVESKLAMEELPAASAIASESVEQTNQLLQEGDSGDLEKVISEDVDLSGLEVKGGEKEGVEVVDAKRSSEYASFGPGSDDVLQKMEHETKPERTTHVDRVPESANVSSVIEDYSILKDSQDSDNGGKEVQSYGDGMIGEEILGANHMDVILSNDTNVAAELGSSTSNDIHADLIEKKTRSPVMDVYQDAMASIQIEDNCTKELCENASGVGVNNEYLEVEEDSKLVKQHVSNSANDILGDSSSQTDSMEANWGSVSVLSALSDAPAGTDTEAVASNDSQPSAETEQGSLKLEAAAKCKHSDKSGVFEPPSFMTDVEPKVGVEWEGNASKVRASENLKHESSATLQAGWLPSPTHVASESPGRKRNEEIIGKVTSWTTDEQQQYAPLKSLLGEAQENPTYACQKDEIPMKNNGNRAEMEKAIIDAQESIAEAVKGDAGKEWNSPARYPANIKREKGKLKNRSYWAPFLCCSSVYTS